MSGIRYFFIQPSVFMRTIVGAIFILSGFMKTIGMLTFYGLPLPWPDGMVLLVGATEIVCGSLLLFNLHVRKALLPLLVIMSAAIVLTILPLLSSHGMLWTLHEARLNLILLLMLVFLWKSS